MPWGPILVLALFKLGLHFAFNGRYGYFIDELYYNACADHLSWGYVDQPPLSAALLAVNRALFGSSLFALRLLPALLGAATVFLTGLMARELGGSKVAQILAGLCVIINPLYLFMHNYYSMNSYDIFFWALAFYLLIRLVKTQQPRLWIGLGLVLGLGLLNKIDVLWLGLGILLGLLLTPARRWLKTPWPYAAAAIAALLFLPHVLWQIHHGWPTLEFIHNATTEKYAGITRADFLFALFLELHPLALPVWLIGLGALVWGKLRRFRLLGILWLTVFALLLAMGHAKGEYMAPAMTALLAAGGVAIEAFARRRARWLPPVSVGLLLLGGALLVPLTLPVLPVETFIRYSRWLGVQPGNAESKELAELPQHYADMFGWENLVATMARVYHRLPPQEQAACAILAPNYGQAGAIDFFGSKHGLPKAICNHNSYWLWGPRDYDGRVLIRFYGTREQLQPYFASVEAADTVRAKYVMPYQNNIPLWICRGLKAPVPTVWTQLKHFE